MSEFKIQNQLSGIIIGGEKNNKISEEDCITPPVSKVSNKLLLALDGPDCSPNGVIPWADDQLTITPGILNKTFYMTTTERSLQSAQTAQVVCLCQNDTPGDVNCNKLESTTDAFQCDSIYLPSCTQSKLRKIGQASAVPDLPPKPPVVSARSLRLDDPEDADTGTSRVSLTLNRPLTQGQDILHNATLGNAVLPHQYHHREKRVDVDLRDWLHDPEGKDDLGRLLSARIQLNGSTGRKAWVGVGADVKILLPLPPRPRPPTLEDRRRREFSEDEVESEYGGME